LLPPIKGKSIVELGSGIGRFTAELAKSAGHVLAMDFMNNLIKKVRDASKHTLYPAGA
jgi:phosphoethanolamine N-methyltransferase